MAEAAYAAAVAAGMAPVLAAKAAAIAASKAACCEQLSSYPVACGALAGGGVSNDSCRRQQRSGPNFRGTWHCAMKKSRRAVTTLCNPCFASLKAGGKARNAANKAALSWGMPLSSTLQRIALPLKSGVLC